MDRFYRKLAIVTGASRGVGKAIVEKMLENHFIVVGLSRDLEQMELNALNYIVTKPGKFIATKCDITKPEEVKIAVDQAAEEYGAVHVLVNAAGVFHTGEDLAGWKEMFEVNALGALTVTNACIATMKKQKVNGHVVFINSTMGIRDIYLPGTGVYGATKHAQTDLVDILREELISVGSKIKVTNISPGFANSDISRNILKTQKIKQPLLSPEDIADAVIFVLDTPPRAQVHQLTLTQRVSA